MARLIRNAVLRAPDWRSILASSQRNAQITQFKDWEPAVYQVALPMEHKMLSEPMSYSIITCHMTKTLNIVAHRKPQAIDERIDTGGGSGAFGTAELR